MSRYQVRSAPLTSNDVVLILCASLAYAELQMGLAAIFRRFTFELYETDVTDVALAHDFFLPCPKLDSKGVRVKVKAVHA